MTTTASRATGDTRTTTLTAGSRAGAPVGRYVEHVMGMPISLALRGRHTGDTPAAAAWAATLAVLRDADRVFSTYRTDSVISRLGRGEIALADCPPEVAEVLALGEAAERDSGGAFAVRRADVLDPSGVVKGWAAERAAAHLAALPDTDFCLSAGGDITCRTLDPSDRPWRIGVEGPHDPGRLVAVVPVHTGAVATSGTAHRCNQPREGGPRGPAPTHPAPQPDLSSPRQRGLDRSALSSTQAPTPRTDLIAHRRPDHRRRRLGRSLIVPSGTPLLPLQH